MKDGVKEFHLTAEPVKREFAPGMTVNAWGYNGATPGPTIEAVEGDRVRFLVTNKLPEHTSVHWHGILLPNGMDGVAGLNQPHIEPGRDVRLRVHAAPARDLHVPPARGRDGADGDGNDGLLRHPPARARSGASIATSASCRTSGSSTPAPRRRIRTSCSTSTSSPSTAEPTRAPAPLICGSGTACGFASANVSMDSHPIHIHGRPHLGGGDGRWADPRGGWWPETTVNVSPGTTRALEFVADNPGDWPLHCHKRHHAMNAMGHDMPERDRRRSVAAPGDDRAPRPRRHGHGHRTVWPSTRARCAHGRLPNTLPMMTGTGPFGPIEMGGCSPS